MEPYKNKRQKQVKNLPPSQSVHSPKYVVQMIWQASALFEPPAH